jgi:hypothetical protein
VTAGVVVVLADDLIWASRLVTAVERAGAQPVRLSSEAELRTVLGAETLADRAPRVGPLIGAVVDLGARRFDPAAAVGSIAAAGKPVIAVAQHDDQVTRKRGLAAGALRVLSYDKMFREGPAMVERWLLAGHAGASAP